jgi:phage shock protein E
MNTFALMMRDPPEEQCLLGDSDLAEPAHPDRKEMVRRHQPELLQCVVDVPRLEYVVGHDDPDDAIGSASGTRREGSSGMERERVSDESASAPAHRWMAPVVLVGVVVVIGYFVLGMPGMDHSGDEGPTMAGMDHSASETAYELLGPAEFEARVGPGVFLVNVHTSYDGEIPGTDAFVSASDISGTTALPEQLDATILVYCRTGRMSVLAAEALLEHGYTRLAVLDGGLDAWEASGRPVAVDIARR